MKTNLKKFIPIGLFFSFALIARAQNAFDTQVFAQDSGNEEIFYYEPHTGTTNQIEMFDFLTETRVAINFSSHDFWYDGTNLKPSYQRTTITTATNGTYTWTFPVAFSGTPVVYAQANDSTTGVSLDVKATSKSTTSVTIQVSKTSLVLGLLTLNTSTPGAISVDIIAFDPP